MHKHNAIWEDFENFEEEVDRIGTIINNLVLGNVAPEDVEVERTNIPQPKTTDKPTDETSIDSKPIAAANKNKTTQPTDLSHLTAETMQQRDFMRMIEEDASRRSADRDMRNAKACALMKRGNAAFREGSLEKALCLFNEAIDTRRDSSVLFTNRAVVRLQLGLLSKAAEDCDAAIKLRDALKPRLIKCKTLRQMADIDAYQAAVQDTKQAFPDEIPRINEYLEED